MKIIRDRYYKHLKFIVFIYILASIVSYGYTIATGTYNGDFSGYVVSLSPIVLGGMLLFSLSPFIYLWSRYSYYKKKKSKYSVPVHIPFVEGVAIFLIIIRLFLFGICIQRGGKVSDLGWLLTVLESISPVIYIYIYFFST
jgi:putative membrane protein